MARRLSYGEPSLTFITSPVQKQTERCYPSQTRPFTVREYARIQTFPDDAVPINLAYELGKSVVNTLDKIFKE